MSKSITNNKWDKSTKAEENPSYWKGLPMIDTSGKRVGKKPIVVELFSGCGGTSLGFEWAGYEIALGLDIHKPSIDTFKRNHPNAITILADIKNVDPEIIKELIPFDIDVLVAGIPCQGFSLNNRKRTDDDERNYLYKEFIRFAKVLNPKVIMIENVSGIRSASNGDFVKEIKKGIEEATGIKVKNKLLHANDYGVPQTRKRVVFVGVQGHDFDFDLVKRTHGPGTSNPYVTVKEAIGDLPLIDANEQAEKYDKPATSEYQRKMRGSSSVLFNHIAPKHPKATIEKIKNTKPGEPIYPRFKQRIRLDWNRLSPTQVSGGIRSQFQFGHPEMNRGETIREKCRLQSFPDSFQVEGGVVQSRVQIGNAVPPLLAEAVAKAILSYLK